MLEEYDGSTSTPTTTLSKMLVWIRIHKVPPLYSIVRILKQLASKVGEVVMVDMKVVSTSTGDFHRARVYLLTARPLVRVVTLSAGSESILLQVKNEKLVRFCAYCGLIGHTHMECGTGEHGEDDLLYGECMVAPSDLWRLGTPRMRDFPSLEQGAPGSQGRREDRGGRSTFAVGHGRGCSRGGRTSTSEASTCWIQRLAP